MPKFLRPFSKSCFEALSKPPLLEAPFDPSLSPLSPPTPILLGGGVVSGGEGGVRLRGERGGEVVSGGEEGGSKGGVSGGEGGSPAQTQQDLAQSDLPLDLGYSTLQRCSKGFSLLFKSILSQLTWVPRIGRSCGKRERFCKESQRPAVLTFGRAKDRSAAPHGKTQLRHRWNRAGARRARNTIIVDDIGIRHCL